MVANAHKDHGCVLLLTVATAILSSNFLTCSSYSSATLIVVQSRWYLMLVSSVPIANVKYTIYTLLVLAKLPLQAHILIFNSIVTRNNRRKPRHHLGPVFQESSF